MRSIPSTDGEILGKIYDGCAATILETEGDWYKIESGSVKGYIKAEYFVTGSEAEALAEELADKLPLLIQQHYVFVPLQILNPIVLL